MAVDREKLRAPIEGLRATLIEEGYEPPTVPVHLVDQIRAAWRNDLATLGLDAFNPDHLAGALAGLVISAKAPDLPAVVYAGIVKAFDTLEPLLDVPRPGTVPPGFGFGLAEEVERQGSTPGEMMERMRHGPHSLVGRVPGQPRGLNIEGRIFDVSQVAEALARGNALGLRFNLGDPADVARLAGMMGQEPAPASPLAGVGDGPPGRPVSPAGGPPKSLRDLWAVFKRSYRVARDASREAWEKERNQPWPR